MLTIGTLQANGLLITKQVGIIQGRLVHELEALGKRKDGQDEQIDASQDSFRLRGSLTISAVAPRLQHLPEHILSLELP